MKKTYLKEGFMGNKDYFMESDKETLRLDIKTNRDAVATQAKWAGAISGMRVGDLGCGCGKTTSIINECTKPDGMSVGIDISPNRIAYAKTHFATANIDFFEGDIREPLDAFGAFDLIFVRFVLEYYRSAAWSIVQNIYRSVKPGGTICLMDLDYNCLNHYGMPSAVEEQLKEIIRSVAQAYDFDPFAGRKLYSYLYDLGCKNIEVDMSAHHLIYGELEASDLFNWTCKVEAAGPLMKCEETYRTFREAFLEFFKDPRRFTYTPLIMCKGTKPRD